MDKKKFQNLTPTKDVDIHTYKDALDYAFETEKVKNVAISGPYSAGKSSLIEAYKNKENKNKFLHISLAHFKETEVNLDNNTLEGKILNQLIHQLNPDSIPLTDFKVKKEPSICKNIKQTALFIISVMLVLYFLFFENWIGFLNRSDIEFFNFTTSPTFMVYAAILFIGVFGYLVYSLVKINSQRNIFKKISFRGNEIEIFQDSQNQDATEPESLFDKYLNEVLYLFEKSNVDAIVFEDLDRYDTNQIFAKLREINTLVNHKKKIKESSTENRQIIRFLYLLRDDIFDSKDRTKFFDFIIPVIPTIDSSNSADKFITYFKKGNILHLFDRNFLEKLSLYIDDMRILINIYNEFLIYKERLTSKNEANDNQNKGNNGIDIKNQKLLAIITYKNMFPKDFSELQLGRGFVHSLFQSKLIIIEKEVEEIDFELESIEVQIEQIENENLESLDELDALYFYPDSRINLSGNQNNLSNFSRSDIIRKLKQSNAINVNIEGRNVNFKNALEKLNENEDYTRRKNIITKKLESQSYQLTIQKDSLLQRKSLLEDSYLQDVITPTNIDKVFELEYLKEVSDKVDFKFIKADPYFRLIKFLIRNGYLDETYSDYMTYFYGHTLSQEDKNFILSITDQEAKSHDYSLNDPKKVVAKLALRDFELPATLNFELLTYLLKNKTDHYKLDRFLKQLIDKSNFEFITSYLHHSNAESKLFISEITNKWVSFFDDLMSNNNIESEYKSEIAKLILYFSSEKIINAQNENGILADFISRDPEFLNIKNPKTELLIQRLLMLNVKFLTINYENSNTSLFQEMYQNELYELNFDNVSMLLKKVYGISKKDSLFHENLSLIYSKPNELLVKYVEKNINEYISNVVLIHSDFKINDAEDVVIKVLNQSKIGEENKKTYIEYLTTSISDMREVKDVGLWELLLYGGNIKYSTQNIMTYFMEEQDLNKILIDFINSSNQSLNSFNTEEFGHDNMSDFFSAFTECNDLLDERYEHLLKKVNWSYTKNFSIKGIEDNKMMLLIENNKIAMEESAFNFIKTHYSWSIIEKFIVKNIDSYIKLIINNEPPDIDEIKLILKSKYLNEDKKLSLLEKSQKPITLIDTDYSVKIKEWILNNNLDKNDLSKLLKNYSKEESKIKNVIKQLALDHITEIRNKEYGLDRSLLDYLLLSDDLSLDIKKDLFAIHLPGMDIKRAKNYLENLEMYDFLGIFQGKRPKFENSEQNHKILMAFKQNNWITKIQNLEDNWYRAISKKNL